MKNEREREKEKRDAHDQFFLSRYLIIIKLQPIQKYNQQENNYVLLECKLNSILLHLIKLRLK